MSLVAEVMNAERQSDQTFTVEQHQSIEVDNSEEEILTDEAITFNFNRSRDTLLQSGDEQGMYVPWQRKISCLLVLTIAQTVQNDVM